MELIRRGLEVTVVDYGEGLWELEAVFRKPVIWAQWPWIALAVQDAS